MTSSDWPYDDALPAMGVVPDTGRGSLPFALLHGESLVAAAAWAVGEAGVDLLDLTVHWDDVRASGRSLLVHDPLCPLTPPAFLARAVEMADEEGSVVVAFRPVTDTVKQTDGERVVATVDRDGLRQVTSPIVVPAAVLTELPQPGPGAPLDLDDFAASVHALTTTYGVAWLQAPRSGARIAAADDLEVLEALGRQEA